MSRFYLARYVFGADPADLDGPGIFYPAGAELVASSWSIDLRPPGSDDGVGLLCVNDPLPTSPRRVALTDDPDDGGVAARLASRLGINLTADSFRRLVLRILLEHGDDNNVRRWNQLKPTTLGWYEAHLGELLYAMPVVAGGATVSDDFNRANSSTLGAGVWTELSGDLEIASNQLRVVTGAAAGTDHVARYETDLTTSNHFAQVDAVTSPNTADRLGVRFRNISSDQRAYGFFGRQNAAITYRISKYSSTGSETAVATVAAAAITLPATLRGEASGSTVTGYDGGVSKVTVSDTGVTGNRRVGVHMRNGALNGQPVLDNFSGGDLAVARSLGANVGVGVSSPGERCFGIAQ